MSSLANVAMLSELRTERPRMHYGFHTQADANAGWRVVDASVEGEVSRPYTMQLTLASEHDDPAKLLGQACTLVMRRDDQARWVHGIVARIAQQGASNLLSVTVTPALEALRHRFDSRIFQDKTVPEVLDEVLQAGLAPYERKHVMRLRREEYPKREYIVQYRETDFAFVTRLMAEEGIWYRFEHGEGLGAEHCELLTLLDRNDDAPEAELGPTGKELPLQLEHGRDDHTRVASELKLVRAVGSTGVEVSEVNWSHPEVREVGEAGELAERPRYEPFEVTMWQYDEPSYARSDAIEQAKLRWERLHGRAQLLSGRSNLHELAVGVRVEVKDHADALDGEWLITELRESGSDTQAGGTKQDYANQFVAQRFTIPLRPARETKPRVQGVALARVVGPDGKPSCAPGADDIHTDEHGRVHVKLTWDRTAPGEADATTTCSLRVVQAWSGAGWGTQFLPRIGMEVVVGFVDGDPDRPLVTGCLYNGLARAPHAPDDDKTKSYIRTQSSPGGGGYNELLFDDAKDRELVSLRAQRDHREHVLRDQTLEIGGSRREQVRRDEAVEVHGTRTHTVHGAETLHVVDGSARLLELSGDDTKRVAKNRELVVSEKTSETHVGGRRVVVKTSDELEVADGAHKRDHVSGQYDIVADEHFQVSQGSDQLRMKDSFHVSSQGMLSLENGGFALRADADGTTTLEVGKQLTIRVGSAEIQLKSDGSVLVSGAKEAKLAAGGSELALNPAGTDLKAPKVALSGDTLVALKGALVTLN